MTQRPFPRRTRWSLSLPWVMLGLVLGGQWMASATGVESVGYLSDGDMDLGVQDTPAAWYKTGVAAVTPTLNANNTTASASVPSEHIPTTDTVTAPTGTCVDCTASHLDDDDGNEVEVNADGLILSEQAIIEMKVNAVPEPFRSEVKSITVTYTGRASGNLEQDLQVWNVTSASWVTRVTQTFTLETTLTTTQPVGSHWTDATDGHVKVRIEGPTTTDYTLYTDHLEVLYHTANGTVTWAHFFRVEVADDETAGVEISAVHGSFVNENRFTKLDLRAGTSSTRILIYANDTVEEQETSWVSIAAGNLAQLKMVTEATGGTSAEWTGHIIVREPGGGWQTRYPITWVLEATT